MATAVEVVDSLRVDAKAWGHRKVTSRVVEFTNEVDERVIRFTFNTHERGLYYAPRHRHNFDQVRFVVAGEVKYGQVLARDGDCIYFPEGVHYGPTEVISEKVVQCTLQTQGPSWSLVPTRDQMNHTSEELARVAEVDRDNGVIRWPDGRVQDSYEATWEKLTGVTLEYPDARYDDICLLRSRNFGWEPSASGGGVSVKSLARFNAGGPAIGLVRIDAGATVGAGRATRHQLGAVISGEVEYAGSRVSRGTLLYYPPGSEYGEIVGREEATILVLEFEPRGGSSDGLRGA